MLHLLSLLLTLVNAPVQTACPLSAVSAVDFATVDHKMRLKACVLRQTLLLQGTAKLIKNVTVPGQQQSTFGAVQLTADRILTVLSATQGYSLSSSLEGALAVVHGDATKGIAVLRGSSSAKVVTEVRDTLSPGRVFFAVDAKEQLHRFSVSGRGDGAFGYYWRAQVQLPLGTPIFNGRGEWVSLVALPAVDAHSYVLPREAFEGLELQTEVRP